MRRERPYITLATISSVPSGTSNRTRNRGRSNLSLVHSAPLGAQLGHAKVSMYACLQLCSLCVFVVVILSLLLMAAPITFAMRSSKRAVGYLRRFE